ncbi:hypothetical protein J6590_033668 [Homalodisca vitripennis]|nr:hypothetical protein J6590_033668 [Homalodisca vitripennis]
MAWSRRPRISLFKRVISFFNVEISSDEPFALCDEVAGVLLEWSGEVGAGAGGISVEDADSGVLEDVVVRGEDPAGLGVVTRGRRLCGEVDPIRRSQGQWVGALSIEPRRMIRSALDSCTSGAALEVLRNKADLFVTNVTDATDMSDRYEHMVKNVRDLAEQQERPLRVPVTLRALQDSNKFVFGSATPAAT